jgi:hypothetical protein
MMAKMNRSNSIMGTQASFVKGTAAARGGAKFGRKALNRWHRRFSGNLEVA